MLVGGAALSFGTVIRPFTFAGFLTALDGPFLLGMLEERRQALIGLLVAFAALAIIISNDPPR